MNIIIFLLKYFILPILSLSFSVFFFVAIYSFFRKNEKNFFVSGFIRGHYFKIKFKLAQKINSIAPITGGTAVEKIYIFFYKTYLKLLAQIILLCGGQKESFEILKEDLQNKYRKEVNIIIDGQKINIEQITEKLKNNQIENKDQVIQELIEKLFQLHKQKQKRATVFSLAGLSILTIASIVISLIIIIIMPAIRHSRASADGVIDSVHKYAWSENIGWINFGTDEGNVHVADSGLTGYGWSKNYGRINLSPSVSGVANDGEGNLSGYAWGENTGLINFSGVTIDSSGYFNGYANGTITGRINFNCANSDSCGNLDYKVRTNWSPRSVRPACNNAIDDDNDGLIDYPNDLGCESLTDDNEVNSGRAAPSNNPPGRQVQTNQPNQPTQTDSNTINPDVIATKPPIIVYPKNNSVVATDKPTFHGTAEARSNVTLEILNETSSLIKITTIANQWGEWYYYTTLPLTNGNYQIKVYAKNSSQNASETIVGNFKVQTPSETIIAPEIEPITTDTPEIIQPVLPSTDETRQQETEQNESGALSGLSTPIAQPMTEPTEPPEELDEKHLNVPVYTSKDEERSNVPAGASTTEPSAPQTTDKPELSGNIEPQNMPTEIIIAKSSYGNINLPANPKNNSEEDGKTNPQIRGLARQTIITFVKPAKPVLKILGQILFNGKTSRLNLKRDKKISSYQNFIGFLKPMAVLAQNENETEKTSSAIQEFTYLDENNDGIYEAQIQLPDTANAYTLKTLIYYKDETIKSLSTPVLVDPQGYIYEKNGSQETRINKSVVALYSLNSETKQYEIWDGSSYNQQNPQNTNQDGSYFFFAPAGKYYITVQAKGYNSYKSEIIDIKESYPIINFNLELKKKTDWFKIIIFAAAGIISLLAIGYCARKIKK